MGNDSVADKRSRTVASSGRYLTIITIPVILLLVSTYLISSRLKEDIEFTRLELEGLHEIESFYQHIFWLQRVRGLELLHAYDESIASDIDEAANKFISGVDASLADGYAHEFGVDEDLLAVRENFQRIVGARRQSHSFDIFEEYSQLVTQFTHLLRRVTERSNLTLDSTSQSHYLSVLLSQRLPAVAESMARLRGLVAYQRVTSNQAALLHKIEKSTWRFEYELSQLRNEMEMLKEAFGDSALPLFERFEKNINSMLNIVHTGADVPSDDAGATQAKALFKERSELIEETRELFYEAALLLRNTLLERLDEEEKIYGISTIGTGIVLIAWLGIVAMLYRRGQDYLQAVVSVRDELGESEARHRSIFESVVDGLITIDDKGVIQDFNPAAEKIFGYAAGDVTGQKINMLMPESYARQHDGFMQNYHETGIKRIIGIGREVEGLHKDGRTFTMDLAVNELWVGGRRLYSGIVRDITERKRIENMKNEFISTVSHELRTPLTSIRGSLGLLLGGAVGDMATEAKEMLKIASNNTERLLLLINDILDVQKIESGMMAFRFERVDLNKLLAQAVKDFAGYGEQYGVSFVVARTIEQVQLFIDRDRLMQVIGNLLSNAAKFSPKGADVELSVARHDGFIRISVTDYGVGIPEEFHSRLFEKFTQSDASDARQKGGTGLGLAISKAIVEKHGGKIDFITKLGVGTTFYIELPELLAEINPSDFNEAESVVPRVDHDARILIVEDDPDVAMLIRRMLTEAGYDSDIAYNAADARKMIAQRRRDYKLVTLDIMLPDEDGISFLNTLRQDHDTRDLPVVVVSVKADEAKRELNGGAVGVLDWLTKPIDQERLVNVVSQVGHKQGDLIRVLHVEDDADIHLMVKEMLSGSCELVWTATLSASREALQTEEFDLVLLDIGLPDGSGFDLLELIEKQVMPPQIVIFSAQEVTKEYADKVSSVLVKSNTTRDDLSRVISLAMGDS